MTDERRRIISFDIGIKNMAYCIFEMLPPEATHHHQKLKIIDWKVVNLMTTDVEPSEQATPLCCHLITTKKQGTQNAPCGKKAVYLVPPSTSSSILPATSPVPTLYVCKKHIQHQIQERGFLPPEKAIPKSHLSKMSKEELHQLCREYGICDDRSRPTKSNAIDLLLDFFKRRCVEKVQPTKKKNANEMNMIDIGRNIKREFDRLDDLHLLTEVIIENQISPIAGRMNMIQGMLMQFFIMKEISGLKISFVSSSNKLKMFPKAGGDRAGAVEAATSTASAIYKQHKKDSILYCNNIIQNNPIFHEWHHVLDSPKKDDYADCFLQCVWYCSKMKWICICLYDGKYFLS